MSFRFGRYRPIKKLETNETLLTKNATVHTVSFRYLETRPVVSIFQRLKRSPRKEVKEDEKKKMKKREEE
ncbi:hypothetical protein V1477_013475 [Vespula maculifrons]|uniref:Uncharacterized protein n=1 Tax=Vespula maculifrons TaxID=7453 RepID=A0ABD2BQ91_VESMC